MNKKINYLILYAIFSIFDIILLICFETEILAFNNVNIFILCLFCVATYFSYYKGFKSMVNSGFFNFILFTIAISIGFGSTLMLMILKFSEYWIFFYVICCLGLSFIYSKLCKDSTSYVSIFSNIIISLIINNLILLNTIICDLFDLTKFNSLLKTVDIDLSGELVINLVLFPVLLMTSCGACINAKDEYYKNKGKDKVINKVKNTQP